MNDKQQKGWFDVTAEEVKALFKAKQKSEGFIKFILVLVGMLLTPITLSGALIGYVRAYLKHDYPYDRLPLFHPMTPIKRVAMIIGAVLIWIVLIVLLIMIVAFVPTDLISNQALYIYIFFNLVFSGIAYGLFRKWRYGIRRTLAEARKFGTARFANADDLAPYRGRKGFYIGGDYTFPDKGHILTCAGTRAGKGTNLIIPNLLGKGGYDGSWVVIDPKGENAAVTKRCQQGMGQNVVILNPWELISDAVGETQSYNPLDLLSDKTSPNLVDDAYIIAEMIIPIVPEEEDKFFSDCARSALTGLILHLVTSCEKKDRTLVTLWQWLRNSEADWGTLLEDMAVNDDAVNGDIIKSSANEILRMMATGDKTWGIIFATLLQGTDFIKSPALSKSLASGFDPYELADGKTTLYVIIPADKLKSHSRWLRLIVTTTMRAVIRKPGKRVCFLLDEFAALGYLPEVADVGLGLYAGFNITLWPIIQTLVQLDSIYGNLWQNFIGNTAVRHFFNINDNFTADYVSHSIGNTSHVMVTKAWFGTMEAEGNERALVTSDELHRESGEQIFTFIGNKPVTYFPKQPYQTMNELNGRYDDNPYYK